MLKSPKILSISPKTPNFLFFGHKIFSSFLLLLSKIKFNLNIVIQYVNKKDLYLMSVVLLKFYLIYFSHF